MEHERGAGRRDERNADQVQKPVEPSIPERPAAEVLQSGDSSPPELPGDLDRETEAAIEYQSMGDAEIASQLREQARVSEALRTFLRSPRPIVLSHSSATLDPQDTDQL